MLLDLEPRYAPARVAPGGTPAPRIRQVVHLHQNVDGAVRHRGHVMQPGVKTQDVLVFHLCDEALTEGWHDVLAKHEPVVRHRCRLAVHLDILALVALGEVGNGRDGRRLGRDRRLPLLDSGDDRRGVLARLLGGELAMRAEGHALRAAEGAGLDDEDLLARGVDADAETGKITVPEDGVLAVDAEAVHDAFRESAILGLRHVAVLLRRGFGWLDRYRRRKRLGSARVSIQGYRCERLRVSLAREGILAGTENFVNTAS